MTFDANGGEGPMSALPVAKGQSAALPAGAFTREGYGFAGWATAANGAAAYADGAAVTPAADMTLYAVWTPVTYTISYELDGGALPQGVPNPEEYTIESDPIQLNAPEKAGSAFGGWYADAQFERQVSGIGQGSTGNKTFWARWETIEVSFGPAAFTLPASLTTIEASAFAGDTALTVMDAHSCTSIGAEAFKGCAGLTQIRLSQTARSTRPPSPAAERCMSSPRRAAIRRRLARLSQTACLWQKLTTEQHHNRMGRSKL